MSLAAVLSVLVAIAPHDPGLSSVRVTREADHVLVHAAFANADFRAATALDADRDGHLTANELAAGHAALVQVATDGFAFGPAGARHNGELLRATIAENDDVELTLRFALAPADAELALALPFLTRLAHGHRCYTSLVGADEAILADALLSPAAAAFALPAVGAAPAAGFGQAMRFLGLGVEHILTGFDHLAFLLALLVAGTSLRRVVATITAFTVAHSVTLLAAARDVVHLPGQLVEATIAGSIVVVAVANLLQRGRAAHRWPLAFAFGLVHGFGFASVLADLSIGGASIAPLLTFNLGVELGQLAFAAVVVPLLLLAARRGHGRFTGAFVSTAVGIAGTWWLIERLLA